MASGELMVRLYEFQGKELLKTVGVPVPEGGVATQPEEARGIAEKIGKPVVVKSQVWTTGRLKAGGIKFAASPEEAEKIAREIIGAEIKGFRVEKVLVEERLDIDKEYYVSVIINDSYKAKTPILMFSTEGGVDIEEVADKCPEKIARMAVDVLRGIRIYDAYDLAVTLGLPNNLLEPMSTIICGAFEAFRKYDARAVEMNPVVLTKDGRVVAVDCRVTIDDSSSSRHPELEIEVAREFARPPTDLDRIAWKIEEDDYRGVCFFAQLVPEIKEKGYVGYHGIGGGGAILGVDALARQGLKIADYADTSGNPTAAKVYRCAKLILSQPGIEGYVLGGFCIANQEQWHHAHGLVKAFREDLMNKPGFPVVMVLAGNKEKESIEILKEGLKDLPIRFEVYGNEHVFDTDFIAERVRTLIEEYRKEKSEVDSHV